MAGTAAAVLVTGPESWRDSLHEARAAGRRVAVVPTMGSLHGGHLSLIRRAAADNETVAVTIYVNPLQFGAGEDLDAYPRDLTRDRSLAAEAGATVVFAPTTGELWPEPAATSVRVTGVSERWEGASRPGHLDGMATIVAKLLSLAGPCIAYFGEKDWQQLTVVRRMVADLSLPVGVVACPTVRDPDGLALSSRNAFLSPREREAAATVYWSLLAGKRAIEDDHRVAPGDVAEAMAAVIGRHGGFILDYAAAVDPQHLTVPTELQGDVRLLIAARLGRTRLIDNLGATVPSAAVPLGPSAPCVTTPGATGTGED